MIKSMRSKYCHVWQARGSYLAGNLGDLAEVALVGVVRDGLVQDVDEGGYYDGAKNVEDEIVGDRRQRLEDDQRRRQLCLRRRIPLRESEEATSKTQNGDDASKAKGCDQKIIIEIHQIQDNIFTSIIAKTNSLFNRIFHFLSIQLIWINFSFSMKN